MRSDGSKIARKRLIAELIMQAAATGKVTFPDKTELVLSPKDWLDMLWKIYGQIDGPPRAEVDVTSGGQSVQLKVVYDDAGIPDTPEEAAPETDGLYREPSAS